MIYPIYKIRFTRHRYGISTAHRTRSTEVSHLHVLAGHLHSPPFCLHSHSPHITQPHLNLHALYRPSSPSHLLPSPLLLQSLISTSLHTCTPPRSTRLTKHTSSPLPRSIKNSSFSTHSPNPLPIRVSFRLRNLKVRTKWVIVVAMCSPGSLQPFPSLACGTASADLEVERSAARYMYASWYLSTRPASSEPSTWNGPFTISVRT